MICNANPAGVRGIGEVAMSFYHATGVRVRDLPITVEKLLR